MIVLLMVIYQLWLGVIVVYCDWLLVGDDWILVILFEGGIFFIVVINFFKQMGCMIYFKVEGFNFIGFFKDCGMMMVVIDVFVYGQWVVLCVLIGNILVLVVVYVVWVGIICVVLILQGKIVMGKFVQVVMYGVKIIQIDGNFDDCLELVCKMVVDFLMILLVNLVNLVCIEGQKMVVFEIVDVLGIVLDVYVLLVGNVGNIIVYWKGYIEYYQLGLIDKLFCMLGIQVVGVVFLVFGELVSYLEIIVIVICIGLLVLWILVVEVQQQFKGCFLVVFDEEILVVYYLVVCVEGVFVEFVFVVSIVGFFKVIDDGWVVCGLMVVCMVIGNGFKDFDIVFKDMLSVFLVFVDLVVVVEKLGLVQW